MNEAIVDSQTISITVEDDEGQPLSGGFIINWYERGASKIIATGSTIRLDLAAYEYDYEIALGEVLGVAYIKPNREHLDTTGGYDITAKLQKIPSVALAGRITDQDGNPIINAQVIVEQYPNEIFYVSQMLSSDVNGEFSANVLQAETNITVSKDGYYNTYIQDAVTGESPPVVSLGTIILQAFENKFISLQINGQRAADIFGQGEPYIIQSFSNLSFSLYNVTKNREIVSITAQYPLLALDDDGLSPGDVIRISAYDKLGGMTAAPILVTLNASLNAEAELYFVDRGYFTASGNGLVLLFDEQGRFVCNQASGQPMPETASGHIISVPLDAGLYTAVFIQNNEFLYKVSDIDKLDELGLIDGEDYIAVLCQITDGLITALGDISIPVLDIGRLIYTDSVTFTANKQTHVLGAGFATYRLYYSIDEKYASSNEAIRVEFPESISFIDNAVKLDGHLAPYSYNNGVLTVFTNAAAGVLRFCAAPNQEGNLFVSAFLNFMNDGDNVLQPLGQVSIEATAMHISAPKRTGQSTVRFSGYASAHSDIDIFDNGIKIGQTTSNAAGRWSFKAELHRPYSSSTHRIYAEATSIYGVKVYSEEKTLEYNINKCDLSKVTMYYGGSNEMVVDYLNPMISKPFYIYRDSSSFTFVVEFTYPDQVEGDVYVVVTGANGHIHNVPTEYDSEKRVWIGTADFDTDNRPRKINVSYEEDIDELDPLGVDYDRLNDDFNDLKTLFEPALVSEDYISLFSGPLIEMLEKGEYEMDFTVTDVVGGIEYGTRTVQIPDSGTINLRSDLIAPDITKESLLSLGYEEMPIPDFAGNIFICYSDTGYTIVDLKSRERWQYETLIDEPDSQEEHIVHEQHNDNIMPMAVNDVFYLQERMAQSLQRQRDASILRDSINQAISTFTDPTLSFSNDPRIQTAVAKLRDYVRGLDGFIALAMRSNNRLNSYNKMYNDMSMMEGMPNRHEGCASVTNSLYSLLIKELLFMQTSILGVTRQALSSPVPTIYEIIKIGGYQNQDVDDFIRAADTILSILGGLRKAALSLVFNISANLADGYLISRYDYARQLYIGCVHECRQDKCTCSGIPKYCMGGCSGGPIMGSCDCEEEDNDDEDVDDILDPSGYVYEAVPSNRIEGVSATVYHKAIGEDEDGMPVEVDKIWDAEEYGQQNPLYTDAEGLYAWDVQEGLWQVRFEKDGYEPAESDWLPVPPPQLEVNVGMTSRVVPNVLSVAGYEDYLDVYFDKYMSIETLTENAIALAGHAGGFFLEFPDAEQDPLANGRFYARNMRIISANDKFNMGETVGLAISPAATSYADVGLGGVYYTDVIIVPEPKSIAISPSINLNLNYGESRAIDVTILPIQAGQSKTITAVSSSPLIVSVTDSAVTDDSAAAGFVLTGNLPGKATIDFLVDGTGIVESVSVDVALPNQIVASEEKVATPTASHASGIVPSGAEISLYTETEGAVIHYTLDGSDPTADSPIFNGAISITSTTTTTIMAIAIKEGMLDSDVLMVTYTMSAAPPPGTALVSIAGSATAVSGSAPADSGTNDIDTTASYTISATQMPPVSGIELEFEVGGNYLSSKEFTAMSGYTFFGDGNYGTPIYWKAGADNIWTGKVTLLDFGGANISGDVDILKMVFDVRDGAEGEAVAVKLNYILLSYGSDTSVASEIIEDTALTVFTPYSSRYDVNKDGIIDLNDITYALIYLLAREGDPGWDEAKAIDFNNDSVIDVKDLVLILANYTIPYYT